MNEIIYKILAILFFIIAILLQLREFSYVGYFSFCISFYFFYQHVKKL